MLDTLKPMCIPVCKAIIWVRCEERPKALSGLDFKDEDLTDIINLYYKMDFCIRAFPLFIKMKKLSEDLMLDFARTSMIKDNGAVVDPFGIEDPWAFKLPESEDIYLFGNPQADMPVQEFSKHRLNAKKLAGIKRFDSHQNFAKNFI